MNKTTEALKLAEEALLVWRENNGLNQRVNKALAAIREALADHIASTGKMVAEPVKQEPVAWRVRGYNQFKTGNPAPWRYVDGTDKPTVNIPDCCDFEPLYAAPVDAKAIRAEALEEAAKWFEANGANMMTKDECAAAIRGLE